MPITFGSVGDIIAVVSIVKDLIEDLLNTFHARTESHLAVQDATLSKLNIALCDNGRRITESKVIATSIFDGLQWLKALGLELKATYKAVLSLQSSLPSRLERTLIGEPFILEDAIGRISPVHLQFISSWAALEAVLEARFRGVQGHDKVQSGKYVLQEDSTGFEISQDRPWEGAFLPGQRINMSLVSHRHVTAQEKVFSATTCPKCRLSSTAPIEAEVQWSVSRSRIQSRAPPLLTVIVLAADCAIVGLRKSMRSILNPQFRYQSHGRQDLRLAGPPLDPFTGLCPTQEKETRNQ